MPFPTAGRRCEVRAYEHYDGESEEWCLRKWIQSCGSTYSKFHFDILHLFDYIYIVGRI
jgi:hypothetical protein